MAIHGKYEHLFDTDQLKPRLKERAIRGGLGTMFAHGVAFVLRTGSMVILARMLMPEHFGLLGMVVTVTSIAERFKDLGLSLATVQRKEITQEQVSVLFWINVAFGTLMMFVIAGLAWSIADFFADQRLVGITLAISASLFVGGLSVQHQALLQRQMRFGELAWIQIASESVSIVIAVGLAWSGFGYWSLVWKEVARPALIAAGMWFTCGWVPSSPAKTTGLSAMLRFGRNVSGFNIVGILTENLDQILLGRVWGAGPLGFYRQARQILFTVVDAIHMPANSVATSTLSPLQHDPEKFSRICEKIVSVLSFLGIPLMTYFIIFSDTLVRVVLGEKWMASAPIFRIFALSGLLSAPYSTCYTVMVTYGKTLQMFWYGVIGSILLAITVSIGVIWGPVGLVIAHTIKNYLWLLPSLWFSYKDTPVSVRRILKTMLLPAFCSFSMGMFLALASPQLARWGSLEIPLSFLLCVLSYCGLWLIFPRGREKFKEYFSYPLLALRSRAA